MLPLCTRLYYFSFILYRRIAIYLKQFFLLFWHLNNIGLLFMKHRPKHHMQLLPADVKTDKMFYNTFVQLHFSRRDVVSLNFKCSCKHVALILFPFCARFMKYVHNKGITCLIGKRVCLS